MNEWATADPPKGRKQNGNQEYCPGSVLETVTFQTKNDG